MARRRKVESTEPTYCGAPMSPVGVKATGGTSSFCGLEQFDSPGGITCIDGHGGAPSLTMAQLKAGPMKPSATAEELKKALDEANEKEIAELAAKPKDWESPNRRFQDVPIGAGYEKIIETMWVEDVKKTYDALEQRLIIGDRRTDYGSVMQHLDEAETNARLAHKLWTTAKKEKKRWELDNEVTFGAMRSEATRSLQREKEQGLRSKQITDADVDSRCATMFPDEYRKQELQRYDMHLMVDNLGNLVDEWNSRAKSLQVILSKQR